MILEVLEKVFSILLTLAVSPALGASYIGGWVWGTMKHCFNVGYGTSISGAEDRAKADQLEQAISTVLNRARQEGRE